MTKREELLQIVLKYPRRTSKEYATLLGRPHASVRRDLTELARSGDIEREGTHPMHWRGTVKRAEGLTPSSTASM